MHNFINVFRVLPQFIQCPPDVPSSHYMGPSESTSPSASSCRRTHSTQYPTRIPVAIPVTAGIRAYARIPVPAKFHFFAGIPYRDFTLNLVIETCQKNKIFQQKFNKKHVKLNTDFKLKIVIFFTQLIYRTMTLGPRGLYFSRRV